MNVKHCLKIRRDFPFSLYLAFSSKSLKSQEDHCLNIPRGTPTMSRKARRHLVKAGISIGSQCGVPDDDTQPGGEGENSLENYSEFARRTGRFNEIAQVEEREMIGVCEQVLGMKRMKEPMKEQLGQPQCYRRY